MSVRFPRRFLAAWLALATLLCFPSLSTAASERAADSRNELFFQSWLWSHGQEVERYQAYLDNLGVGNVLPQHELLRTASDWSTPQCQAIGAQPFEVPPPDLWPSMVKTLELLRQLKDAGILGAVEAVSVYRHPELNRCAGSRFPMHPGNTAVDLVAASGDSLDRAVPALCDFHDRKGQDLRIGLGLYGYPKVTRVHIDTHGYRTWGSDLTERSSPCAALRASRPQKFAGAGVGTETVFFGAAGVASVPQDGQ